jgi:hypothetical protein
MSENRMTSDYQNKSVLQLEDRRTLGKSKNALFESVRIKAEIDCHESTGKTIKNAIYSKLTSHGCLIVDYEKPDWVLSVIALSHGTMVQMSIILRKLFRSTTPGTEVDHVDSKDQIRLRKGAWLYESLRFHGLYSVPIAHLDHFFEKLLAELSAEHWKDPSQNDVAQRT